MPSKYYTIFCAVIFTIFASEYCNVNQDNTESSCSSESTSHYYKDVNNNWEEYKRKIQVAVASYEPCSSQKCSCHNSLIAEDLSTFSSGISCQLIKDAMSSGILYQVINNRLFRQNECMFPSRCSGIEHFIFKIINKLPNMEFVVNTRDWPQVLKGRQIIPVFSFSKTKDYLDIAYPAWTFWEGGPAIKLYPTGLGRFDILRKSLMAEAEKVPWSKKQETAFFRGSRTSAERDPLVKLSRKDPGLVDAQYTKNQAWKSDADTLYAPPADEVSFEGHCVYKYLFNYRGVAASFRLKHLFLCGSLVFHVGQDWIEFFYPQLKPWVHYIPVPSDASEDDLRDLILFAKSNDELVKGIADRGFEFIRDHLRLKDALCYWKKLLIDYSKLLKYEVQRNEELIEIKKK